MKSDSTWKASAAWICHAHARALRRKPIANSSAAILCVLALLSFPASVSAIPITYLYEGVGTGTVGQSQFRDAAFTITALANTDNITPWSSAAGGPQNTHLSTKVDIAGLPPFSITTPAHSWMHGVEPGQGGIGQDLFVNWITMFDEALLGYGLDTAFGPFFESQPEHVNQFSGVETTAGLLTFSSIDFVTFTAIIPEPTSFVLAAFGGLACLRWRGRIRRSVRK